MAWSRVSRAADVVLIAATLVVVAILVRREVFSRAEAEATGPRSVANWQQYVNDGHIVGAASAPVKIALFSDFQCTACGIMHAAVKDMLLEYDSTLAVVYRHLPSNVHPTALSAALASECAAEQGRFAQFSNVLFEEQNLIGIAAWADFARTAAVPDVPRFERCVQDRKFVDRVKADMVAARELEVRATPSYIVDGILITGASRSQLRERVRKAVAARQVANR